jgi:hypothetical protein
MGGGSSYQVFLRSNEMEDFARVITNVTPLSLLTLLKYMTEEASKKGDRRLEENRRQGALLYSFTSSPFVPTVGNITKNSFKPELDHIVTCVS